MVGQSGKNRETCTNEPSLGSTQPAHEQVQRSRTRLLEGRGRGMVSRIEGAAPRRNLSGHRGRRCGGSEGIHCVGETPRRLQESALGKQWEGCRKWPAAPVGLFRPPAITGACTRGALGGAGGRPDRHDLWAPAEGAGAPSFVQEAAKGADLGPRRVAGAPCQFR